MDSLASDFQKSRFLGCLLGGAVGDALGAPVELKSRRQILDQFGPNGIQDFAPAYGRIGAITDDTQMTLFTAEGLLRAQVRMVNKGICHPPSVVHRAYLRWLHTQGESPNDADLQFPMDGWLIGRKELWARRSPGLTCISALRHTRQIGNPAANDSKGCGGVTRIAPVGLAITPDMTFRIGHELAALTHGHPSGYLSAAYLSVLIRNIVNGASLEEAMETAVVPLVAEAGHEEVLAAIESAWRKAHSKSRSCVSEGKLGNGWVAEEALSIALYCSIRGQDFEEAITLAVNHSGDSDSTGSIAGNICGALYGVEAIPRRWLECLEMHNAISEIALDLYSMATGRLDLQSDTTWDRYPGF